MIRLDGGKMKKILFSMLLLIAFSFTQEVLTKKNINIDKNNLINKNVNIKGGNSSELSLNPNMPIGSANLTEPTINIDFNEDKYEKSIDVFTDEVSISGLMNQNKLREHKSMLQVQKH